jgi:hypothetical protein
MGSEVTPLDRLGVIVSWIARRVIVWGMAVLAYLLVVR